MCAESFLVVSLYVLLLRPTLEELLPCFMAGFHLLNSCFVLMFYQNKKRKKIEKFKLLESRDLYKELEYLNRVPLTINQNSNRSNDNAFQLYSFTYSGIWVSGILFHGLIIFCH